MFYFQNTLAVTPWRILTSRHETGSAHYSSIHCPICPIFLMLHEGSVLNTSVHWICIILIAPLVVVKQEVLITPPFIILFLRDFSHLMKVARSLKWRHTPRCATPQGAWSARARSLLLAALVIIIFSFFRNKCLFRALNMHENSRNSAHTSGLAKNLIFHGCRNWAWQNGSTAPPGKFETASPASQFIGGERNSVDMCTSSRHTKKSLGAIPEVQQEVRHFALTLQKNAYFRSFLPFPCLLFERTPPTVFIRSTSHCAGIISRPL